MMPDQDAPEPEITDAEAPVVKAPRQPLAPNTPGAEALAVAEEYFAAKIGGNPSQCAGILRWRAFIASNPEATLADCLNEFERVMQTGEADSYWPTSLAAALGPIAYSSFKVRVFAHLDSESADRHLRHDKDIGALELAVLDIRKRGS